MAVFGMTEDGKPLHPGRILLGQAMEPLGISRNQLARDIDVPVGRISDITNAKRGITADTALRLGRYFGTGPELWLRLQAEYDLHVARITTWPAVESRVRTLETLKSEPVPASHRQAAIDISDSEADRTEPEDYPSISDIETETESGSWTPTALPETDTSVADVRVEPEAPSISEAPSLSEVPALSEEPTRVANPEPASIVPASGANEIASEPDTEEDIGIPPAPGAGTIVSR